MLIYHVRVSHKCLSHAIECSCCSFLSIVNAPRNVFYVEFLLDVVVFLYLFYSCARFGVCVCIVTGMLHSSGHAVRRVRIVVALKMNLCICWNSIFLLHSFSNRLRHQWNTLWSNPHWIECIPLSLCATHALCVQSLVGWWNFYQGKKNGSFQLHDNWIVCFWKKDINHKENNWYFI